MQQFKWHTWLKEILDSQTTKFYYFRYNDDDIYECEEFTLSNNEVLEINSLLSNKEKLDSLRIKQNVVGTSPVVYFGKKKMGWKAFGEDLMEDI